MSGEFWSVWVEDPEVPGRWLTGYGAGRENAERYRDDLVAKGRKAFLLPFGHTPKCRECGDFCSDPSGICEVCELELPAPQYQREVA